MEFRRRKAIVSPNRHRRTLLKAFAVSCLTGMTPLIRAAHANGEQAAPSGIYKIRGRVTINGVLAREGALINSGDTVVTEAGSEAVYVIGKDAFLQRASSAVVFGNNALRILTGKLLSAFGKGAKNIETPAATIGIRGTACDIEVEEQRTYFCLCYGTADLQPVSAPQERMTIVATHHDFPLYIYADKQISKKIVSAKMIGHTDEELVMLENLVGRKPPFSK